MRKPVVDYRKLRPNNIASPEFRHLLYLLGWVGYFIAYFITEQFIPREVCVPIHCRLDDLIPFCEYFVIPYVFWYVLIVASLLYFALYNPQGFKDLSGYIIITQIVAMTIYIAFPNRQDLRPETFERDNIFTKMVGFLYSFDTSTNVCPSLHVGYSLGIASVWLKEKSAKLWMKIFVVISVIFICMSICFIKQHSAVDFFAVLPVCLFAELVIFRKRYFKKKAKISA